MLFEQFAIILQQFLWLKKSIELHGDKLQTPKIKVRSPVSFINNSIYILYYRWNLLKSLFIILKSFEYYNILRFLILLVEKDEEKEKLITSLDRFLRASLVASKLVVVRFQCTDRTNGSVPIP